MITLDILEHRLLPSPYFDACLVGVNGKKNHVVAGVNYKKEIMSKMPKMTKFLKTHTSPKMYRSNTVSMVY